MARLTFQVIDGADKGTVFLDVATPLTVGRETGNSVRLNDERVSRCHLKVQEDHGQIVLTDLDSTNGTRVNGQDVQLRVLRVGDLIRLGRSVLLFGSPEEIADLVRSSGAGAARITPGPLSDTPVPQPFGQTGSSDEPTLGADERQFDSELGVEAIDWAQWEGSSAVRDSPRRGTAVPPPLPSGLSPAQAAGLAELLDYVHRTLAELAETVSAKPKAKRVRLDMAGWQGLLALEMQLARYLRRIANPEGE